MNQNDIKTQIQTLLDKLCSKYCMLNPKAIEALIGYYHWRLSDNWDNDTTPHPHFWINTDNEQDSLWIATSIIQNIGPVTNEKSYGLITEQDFLHDPDSLLKQGKNKFIIINECNSQPLDDEKRSQWEHIKKILSHAQCPTFFLLASSDVIKQKFSVFETYERYILQIFICRIDFKNNFSIEDYQNTLNYCLDSNPNYTRLPEFDQAMTQYLQTIVPKASLKGHDFIKDLEKRVVFEYHKHEASGIFDKNCIPPYRKDISASQDSIKEPTKTSQTKNPREAAPALFHFSFPETGDFFEKLPDEQEKNTVKNVLLLTLSTTSYVKHLIKISEDEPPKPYYYQLEPVPYQLMHDFNKENSDQRLDGILMICSKETKDLKPGKNEEFSPQDFESSAYNYFKYQTAQYAKEHCGYALSFHEINTYREFGEEKYTKLDTSEILSSVMETIRKLKKRYTNLNFYVDVHGGSRTDQEILNNALSLLKMEGVHIQKEHIYNVSTPGYEAGTESHIVPAGEIFDTLDFVSGIHACANYGQAKSLSGYLSKCNTDAERNTLKNMQTVAEGIQLCDIRKFENGLSALFQSLADMETENSHTYLSVFRSLIQSSYGDNLLNPSKRTTIREIQWCIDKGFFQQALTLLESKMPKEIIKNGFLISEASNDIPSLFDENYEIVPDIRRTLLENGIPQHADGSLENVIVYKADYVRGQRIDDTTTIYLYLNQLPQADRILEELPPLYVSGPRGDLNANRTATSRRPLQIRLTGYRPAETQNRRSGANQRMDRTDFTYNIRENPEAAHEINVLLRLYYQLKKERNATNHAGDHENRSDLDTIKNALECYIRLYNHILELLHH